MFLAFNIQLLHFLTNGKRYNFIILRISNAMMNLCYKVHTTCNIKRIRLVAEKQKSASLVGCNIKFETFFCFILTQRRNSQGSELPISFKKVHESFFKLFITQMLDYILCARNFLHFFNSSFFLGLYNVKTCNGAHQFNNLARVYKIVLHIQLPENNNSLKRFEKFWCIRFTIVANLKGQGGV